MVRARGAVPGAGAKPVLPRAHSCGLAGLPSASAYGGAYEDVIPHLTVADRRLADLPTLEAAERAVHPGLLVTARIGQAVLIAGTQAPASWCVIERLSLGAAVSSAGGRARGPSMTGPRPRATYRCGNQAKERCAS